MNDRDRTDGRGPSEGGGPEGAETNGSGPWGGPLTEAELVELALAADPDVPLDPEAVPIGVYLGVQPGLLPDWYMPAPTLRRAGAWRRPVVLAVVAAFVIIEALGLCSTFGPLVPG